MSLLSVKSPHSESNPKYLLWPPKFLSLNAQWNHLGNFSNCPTSGQFNQHLWGLFFLKSSQVTEAHRWAENPCLTWTPAASDVHLPCSFLPCPAPEPWLCPGHFCPWYIFCASETLPSWDLIPAAPQPRKLFSWIAMVACSLPMALRSPSRMSPHPHVKGQLPFLHPVALPYN